jgi:hypothetical protein
MLWAVRAGRSVRNLWRGVQFYQHSKTWAPFCLMQFPKNDCCFDRLSKVLSIPDGIYIMSKEIGAEAVLENCRALINQSDSGGGQKKARILLRLNHLLRT